MKVYVKYDNKLVKPGSDVTLEVLVNNLKATCENLINTINQLTSNYHKFVNENIKK